MSRAIHANRSQRMLLPPDLDEWVSTTHPVRFVAEVVGALDLAKEGFRESPGKEGRPHFAPELLLGVWLFGWMERIRSTRKLEKALHTQIAFMWLTGNLKPDHVTLWTFFDDNRKPLRRLMKLVVKAAAKAGLVGYALHALDGTKLSAACSTETALHRATLEKKLTTLDAAVDAAMKAIEAHEKAPPADWTMPAELKSKEALRETVRAALKQLDEAEAAHLNVREPEARVKKTREGLKLGYNAQIVVDHDSDLIVAEDVVTDATDFAQLVPMIEAVKATLGKVAEETVADKGYASGAQFMEAERRHLPVLVASPDEASAKRDYAKSKFTFERERNLYVCPRGEELPLEGHIKASGGKAAFNLYRCTYGACPVRAACTKDKKGRAIKRFDGEDAVARQNAKLKTPEGEGLYGFRKEIVEHVFGIIKANDGFRRFTAWGLESAQAQWSLACLALNLRKLLPAYQAGTFRIAHLT